MKQFEDSELEQMFSDFMTSNPLSYSQYANLAVQYSMYQSMDDEENQELFGTAIFNLIMPCAQKIDPRLIKMIPPETLNKFEILYEDDNFHIKSWVEIDGSYSRSNSGQSSDDDSGSEGSEQSGSSSGQDISANSQAIGDSSDQEDASQEDEDPSQMDIDTSQPLRKGERGKKDASLEAGAGFGNIPQCYLTGKNKSLTSQVSHAYPNNKNKHDLRTLDTLFKSLKDEKDWISFCKVLFLYFEGVLSLTEFCKIYEDKFSSKLK